MSVRPIQDSVNGWLFEKIENDLKIEKDTGRIKTIIKLTFNAALLPIFAVAAVVETVARTAILLLAKVVNFFVFSDWDLAKWMNINCIIPITDSVILNGENIGEYFDLLVSRIVPIHINGYQLLVDKEHKNMKYEHYQRYVQ